MTGRHIADQRTSSTGAKLQHFLRLSRSRRETFHKPRSVAGKSRLVQFLRIARGQTA